MTIGGLCANAPGIAMFGLTALELARIQFGFTISFHIIFPAITIGLASYLTVLEACWLRTRQTVYRDLYHFWSKIFAVNFGMGVVSGIVMAYQFGTNWSYFSDFAGGVTGPLLTYEVLTAFFLEAGFLGVMLFGWNRVGPALHFLSTAMVALGTLISATWILASNSWMHTPQGFDIIDGRVVPTDWFAVIFNPSFPYRLVHMSIAAFLATALFVGASAAWHMLRGQDSPAIRKMMSMSILLLVIVAPIQAIVGDFHGLNTLKHQPVKLAAMEGHWENHPGQGLPLILFGWPDMEREETRFSLEVPRLGSLILTHSWDGQIAGMKEFAPARPSQFDGGVLVLPHHGGPGFPDDRAGRVGRLVALARHVVEMPAIPEIRLVDGAGRPGGDAGRLVHHRDWPPALGGVRPAAHRRRRLASRRGPARHFAGAVRAGVLRRVRHRRRLCAADGAQGAAARRRPAEPSRAGRARSASRCGRCRPPARATATTPAFSQGASTWASIFPSYGRSSSCSAS